MRTRKKLALAATALAIIFTACQKDNLSTNNEDSELGVQFKAHNTSFALPVTNTKSAAVSMD